MKRFLASLGLVAITALFVAGCATTPGSSAMASSEIEAEQAIAVNAEMQQHDLSTSEHRALVAEYRQLHREI